MEKQQPQCAQCPYDWSERYCHGEPGKAPQNCPSLRHRDCVRQSLNEIASGEVREFARQASIQEAAGYGHRDQGYQGVRAIKPRIVETVEFARRMHYQRIALVFCVGLRREAAVVQEIFTNQGLEVISIVCKVGAVPKEALGLSGEQKIVADGFESMCNPIAQALIANDHQAQFNVLLGLCVGHDSLFLRYARAPCTVLAVKDRLLGHNPLAAIHQYESYYRYLKQPLNEHPGARDDNDPKAGT
jgi:uncharacterized metal-binding protein